MMATVAITDPQVAAFEPQKAKDLCVQTWGEREPALAVFFGTLLVGGMASLFCCSLLKSVGLRVRAKEKRCQI